MSEGGKMGCGTLIALIIIFAILGSLGVNSGIGYVLANCGDTDEIVACILGQLEEEPEPEGAVTATGVYTFKDYSVNVTSTVPLEGGAVTGTVSGTCDGKLTGSFDGQNNGVISGTFSGACSPFFINIPTSGDFSGTVNKDGKVIPVGFTGSGAGVSHTGSMSLSYTTDGRED